MPDTRENLIELVNAVLQCLPWGQISSHTAGDVADYLIANGVTVGKLLTEYLHPIAAYAGLKSKYLVFKADTGKEVVNCFVLRPDKDTAAVKALRAYANATDNKALAKDIYNWIGKELKTNADRIRAMSDEELADCLKETLECDGCPVDGCDGFGMRCRDTLLKWLRQPAEVTP